jgi:hypothetical protein
MSRPQRRHYFDIQQPHSKNVREALPNAMPETNELLVSDEGKNLYRYLIAKF